MCLLVLIVTAAEADLCAKSDAKLREQKIKVCASLIQTSTPWCGQPSGKAHRDWPSQAVYLVDLLQTLLSPQTCLHTNEARGIVAWLNETQVDISIQGNFAYTWQVFQRQYYDMPRKASTSPKPLTLALVTDPKSQQGWLEDRITRYAGAKVLGFCLPPPDVEPESMELGTCCSGPEWCLNPNPNPNPNWTRSKVHQLPNCLPLPYRRRCSCASL